MPTYTYQCADCGHTYDAFQAMKDAAHTVCPACGGKVERLIGAGAGIVFKGSGFYVTDYRSGGNNSGGGSSSGSTGGGEGGATASGAAATTTKSDAPAPKSTESKGGGSSSDS